MISSSTGITVIDFVGPDNVTGQWGRGRSRDLHEGTELPGMFVSAYTAAVIRTRYTFARQHLNPGTVVEIGCGPGAGLMLLEGGVENRCTVLGIDLNMDNLRISRRRDGPPVACADAERLPFLDQSLSGVVSLAMIYYVDLERFAAEVRRVLRPGGTWIFCTSNQDVAGFVPSPHTVRYYRVPELLKCLQKSGFQVELWGAFPDTGGSPVLSALRGRTKNILKYLTSRIPRGLDLWDRARRSLQPLTEELPQDFLDLSVTTSAWVPLSGQRRDRLHRVIYVVATPIQESQ